MALAGIRKNNRHFPSPKLQITAMMDMFTIILIFLLFSFSSQPDTIEIDKNLQLPQSSAKIDYNENFRLIVSENHLQLDDKIIAAIKNGNIIGINSNDLTKSDLYKALRTRREKYDRLNLEQNSPPILFLCDKRLSFKTINDVVKTAGLAGFPDFQFAVLEK